MEALPPGCYLDDEGGSESKEDTQKGGSSKSSSGKDSADVSDDSGSKSKKDSQKGGSSKGSGGKDSTDVGDDSGSKSEEDNQKGGSSKGSKSRESVPGELVDVGGCGLGICSIAGETVADDQCEQPTARCCAAAATKVTCIISSYALLCFGYFSLTLHCTLQLSLSFTFSLFLSNLDLCLEYW